jgi:hypothetical protein
LAWDLVLDTLTAGTGESIVASSIHFESRLFGVFARCSTH